MNKTLTLFAILLAIATQGFADRTGSCGDNATWTLNETTGVLTITGTGKMKNYYESPFYSFRSSIKQIIISNGITGVGNFTFKGCSFATSISIPSSVTSIGAQAFAWCTSVTSLTIPASVTSIGNDAFIASIGLTSLNVESGNPQFDSRDNCNAIINKENNELMYGCKTTTIPSSVTSIGMSAFYNCTGLKSIDIPNSVTTIKDYAFEYCSDMTSLTIPASVTSIGDYAFDYCPRLEEVVLQVSKPISMYEHSFSSAAYKNAILKVNADLKDTFASAPGWGMFANIEEVYDESDEFEKYDCNGDGMVNSTDIVAIYNFIANGGGKRK